MLLCEGDCTATAEKGLDCRAQLYFYFSTSVSFGLFNFSHFELWRSPNTVAAAAQQQINLPRNRTRVHKSKFMKWLMASEKKTKTCCIVDDQQRQVKRPDKSLLCQASEGILLDTRAACEIGNFNCEPRTRWTEQKCKERCMSRGMRSFHSLRTTKSINPQSRRATPKAKHEPKKKSRIVNWMAKLLLTSLIFYCFPWEISHNLSTINSWKFRAACFVSEIF